MLEAVQVVGVVVAIRMVGGAVRVLRWGWCGW